MTVASEPIQLVSGAEARVTNGIRAETVVWLGGGRKAEDPGNWSASNEWLVRRLAPRFASIGFVEVRYRIRSWQRLDLCVDDARAALECVCEEGAERILLVGFSMGGAVAVSAADHPAVGTVLGLAPWLPDRLPLDALAGRRFVVIHGALDRNLPGIPGVSAASSRHGLDWARGHAREVEYTLIPGGFHGAAVRPRWGLTPLPRARRWAELVAQELERFREERSSEPGARAES